LTVPPVSKSADNSLAADLEQMLDEIRTRLEDRPCTTNRTALRESACLAIGVFDVCMSGARWADDLASRLESLANEPPTAAHDYSPTC
jgi:hypothetical protein